MDKKKNEIDAIEMKRNIQKKIYDETKDMSFEEFKRYVDKKIGSSKVSIFPHRQIPI